MSTGKEVGVKYDSGIRWSEEQIRAAIPAGVSVIEALYQDNKSLILTFTEPEGGQTSIFRPPYDWWKNNHLPSGEQGLVPVEQVSVVRINEKFPAAQAATREFIRLQLVENGGFKGGTEIEYGVSYFDNPNARVDLFPEQKIELANNQREDSGSPYYSAAEVSKIVAAGVRQRVLAANRKGVVLDQAGVPAASLRIQEIELNSDFPYVPYMAKAISDHYVLPYLEQLDPDVYSAWEAIAVRNGYSSLVTMLEENSQLNYWYMNAGHASMAVPTDEQGRTFEAVNKNVANALTMFAGVINLPAYSGSFAFGQRVEMAGKPVADSRTLLSKIVATANPTKVLEQEEQITSLQIEAVSSGITHTPDRGGSRSAEITSKAGEPLTGTHAIWRMRNSVTLAEYIAAQANGDLASLGKKARLEYTDRSISPDLVKYEQSLALQEIVHLAGLQSIIDGYEHFSDWLVAKKLVSTHAISQLEQISFAEVKAGLSDDYPKLRLATLAKIIDYFAGSEEYSQIAHLKQTLAKGRLAVESAQDWAYNASLILAEWERNYVSDGAAKFDYYLTNRELFPNWGSFINLLSGQDLLDIITSANSSSLNSSVRLLQNLGSEVSDGDLAAAVNHIIAQVSAEHILQGGYLT